MKLSDFIARGKKILNEEAGSEGLVYTLATSQVISEMETELLKISDIETVNGDTVARVEFTYPRDYGFALNTLKVVLGDIDIISLQLVY